MKRRFVVASAAISTLAVATGCKPKPTPTHETFVGKWQSSLLATPIYLHDNGEWEIKQDDGLVLQYGVWEYKHPQMVWHHKLGRTINREINLVLSSAPASFQVRELDGATTTFIRLN